MRVPVPDRLPTSLADYLPGRVVVVPEHRWDVPDVEQSSGVRTQLPRYGLELRTLEVPIEPLRVQWLVERTTIRPLDARIVDVVHHRGRVHVVDRHHELAAHLLTGSERIPVRLARATGPQEARATGPHAGQATGPHAARTGDQPGSGRLAEAVGEVGAQQ